MIKKIRTIIAFMVCFFVLGFGLAECDVHAFAIEKKYDVSAESMVTIEANSKRVLYSKNENKRLPMASTTKILTAIVAIENCKDLDQIYEIPKEAVGIEGSSIYLKAGEHLSVRELLYGLMLRSGNDSAVAIAIIVAGSVENFVKLMNKYCEKLQLKNTHIVTVNGLHDDDHYTSAYDLSLITASAFENETFSEIVATKDIKINNEKDKINKCRFLKNKNKLLSLVEGADGVKTGYTKKAGKCFVGSATRGKMKVVCVVLNSKTMFEDCAELIEKAFFEFKMIKLLSKGEIVLSEIKNAKTQKVPIILKKDVFYPLKDDEKLKITAKINIDKPLVAPIKEDCPVGSIDFRCQNDLIFSDKIYTINIEKNKEVKDYINKIIKAF